MSSGPSGNPNFRADRTRSDRLLFSGGLGVSVVAVTQLLQLSELSRSLSISLHFFALSIPLLSLGVLVMDQELAKGRHVHNYRAVLVAAMTGLATTLCGVAGLFLHLGTIGEFFFRQWEVLAIFVVGSVIAYFVLRGSS